MENKDEPIEEVEQLKEELQKTVEEEVVVEVEESKEEVQQPKESEVEHPEEVKLDDLKENPDSKANSVNVESCGNPFSFLFSFFARKKN
uniref:Uncharacterized protein n=1 Tax=viral metagenome TaxID=1070528 RepID=A0A6C0ESC3_9ZZZZ